MSREWERLNPSAEPIKLADIAKVEPDSEKIEILVVAVREMGRYIELARRLGPLAACDEMRQSGPLDFTTDGEPFIWY